MYVKVKVTPGAKKAQFKEESADTLSVSVREPAERNLANRAVAVIVAGHFKVALSQVRLVSGHRSRTKIFSVEA